MNSNLISLLSKLKQTELKSVVRFAKSPYHNSNKLIIELLKALLVFYPDFNHKKLTKEYIFRKINSKGIYDDGRMSVLMTQLAKLIERFYMYQEFEEDEFLQMKIQGKGFLKRNFKNRYQKQIEKALNIIESQEHYDEEYFYNQYYLHQDLFFKTITHVNQNEQRLPYAIENLNQFYLAARLKINIEEISRKKSYANQKSEIISNELLSKIKISHKENLLLDIYKKIILLRTTKDYQEELYEETKNLFEQNVNKFSTETKRLIYSNLSNYNIHQYSRGNLQNRAKLIKLFKIGEENNLILINNTITPISYMNFVSHLIEEKEYDWCKKFIFEYESFLPTDEANDSKLQALAFWSLCKGNETPKDFELLYNVLKLMRDCKVRKKDSRVTFRNKSIIIRAYYDLILDDRSYGKILEVELLNFENQLKKDKIAAKYFVDAFIHFIRYTRRLLKIKINKSNNIKEIKQLEKEISTISGVAALAWIKQKIEELLPTPQSKD